MTGPGSLNLQNKKDSRKLYNFRNTVLFAFILSACFVTGAVAEAPLSNKADLQRRYDAVVIKGENLGALQGESISNIRVFAYENDHFQIIPFQVDERTPGNDYALPSGPGASTDIDGGLLDYNDELVIMARDAGNRADNNPDLFFSSSPPEKWVEMELLDPIDPAQKAWVYVCSFKKNKPPLSPIDYVRYNPQTEQIFSDHYGLGYGKGMVLYTDLFYPDGKGGYGPDLLDRIKVRITVKFFLNIFKIKKNEGDFHEEVVSWKDGPVRVLRNVRSYVSIMFKLSSPDIFSVSEYYPDYMFTPLQITVPKNLKRIFSHFGISDFSWYFYGDLPGLEGGKIYTNKYPQGIPISEKAAMAWYDKDIDTRNLAWGCAIKKGTGVWFNNIVIPDILYQFTHLYLNVDKSGKYPPEDIPGEIAGGAFMSWEDFNKEIFDYLHPGLYELALETFFPPADFSPQGVQEWRNIREFPVQAIMTQSHPDDPRTVLNSPPQVIDPKHTGQGTILTDIHGKEFMLYGVRLHTGSIRATGFNDITGRDAGSKKWYSIPFNDITSIHLRIETEDTLSGLKSPLIAEITKKDNEKISLIACKCCTISGFRRDGKRVGNLLSQIKEIRMIKPR